MSSTLADEFLADLEETEEIKIIEKSESIRDLFSKTKDEEKEENNNNNSFSNFHYFTKTIEKFSEKIMKHFFFQEISHEKISKKMHLFTKEKKIIYKRKLNKIKEKQGN